MYCLCLPTLDNACSIAVLGVGQFVISAAPQDTMFSVIVLGFDTHWRVAKRIVLLSSPTGQTSVFVSFAEVSGQEKFPLLPPYVISAPHTSTNTRQNAKTKTQKSKFHSKILQKQETRSQKVDI